MNSLITARVPASSGIRGPARANRRFTSLVFPVYNPGPAIVQTWNAIREFVLARPDDWEAIFVCDGCTDGTATRLNRLITEAHDTRFRVIAYEPNRGKGYAVRTGLLAARGTVRIFTDVDLAYSFKDVLRVADTLRDGASVVIASREHPESTVQLPPHLLGYSFRRRLQSRLFGALTRFVLPIQHRDTQAGLKGMTATVAERILPSLSCDGFGFDCELLTACSRLSVPITEVPVNVRCTADTSTTGLRATLRMLYELRQIRRAWSHAPDLSTIAVPQAV